MANVKQIKQKTTGTLLDVEDTQARADIASEVVNRTNADKALDDKVKAETTNRTNADNELQEEINTNKNDISKLKGDLDYLENKTYSVEFDHIGDLSTITGNGNIDLYNYGMFSRLKKVENDCYVNKIKIICDNRSTAQNTLGATLQIGKFKLSEPLSSSSIVSDVVLYDDVYPYYSSTNEILLKNPIKVNKGEFIGIKLNKDPSLTYGIQVSQVENTSFDNSGVVWLNTSNTSVGGLYHNYTPLVDFELVYNTNKKDVLRGLKYVAYGDSITSGYGCSDWKDRESGIFNNQKCNGYVRQLADKHAMTFKNYGLAGYGFSVDSSGYWASSIVDSYKMENADIVTFAYGTNDFGVGTRAKEFGTIQDSATTETFCGLVRKAFDSLTTNYPMAKIFIILPIPRGNMSIANTYGKTLKDYADAIETIAIDYGFPTLNMLKKSNFNIKSDTFCSEYFVEGNSSAENLHPKENAHTKYLLPIIENFILDSFEK